ncbi:MAG: glycosyltransferase family 4 protein [Phototrophicaceae bacterium]
MPKLLIASGIFHPESGGPATYLYHLLPHLQAHGYDIRVLTFGEPDAERDRAYPYPITRISRTAPFLVRNARYAQAALPLMLWADAVYLHTLNLPLPPIPKPLIVKIVGDQAWERAIRLGWLPPTSDIDAYQFSRYWSPLLMGNKWLNRREIRRVKGVIVPSLYLKHMVVHWGAPLSRVQVIYNAPPFEPPPNESPAEARAALELPLDRPIVLTVARLVAWKGVDALIEAIDAVPNALLLIAGDGEDRATLESLTQSLGRGDQVRFLGKVPHAQTLRYMRAADYVALYSGYEGLSHTLLESLHMGTPVIASRKGGNPEVVTHGVNGLLVEYPRPDALRQALAMAFEEGVQASLAANTSVGLERFDHTQMIAQTVAALQRFGA